jgi:hypothetical protein
LPPPPNASKNWQSPVLLHGDFNGVKIFHSLRDAIRKPVEGEEEHSARFVSLGDDELGGQVLSIIDCDFDLSSTWIRRDGNTVSPPCCFIGYASGRVAAVSLNAVQSCVMWLGQVSSYNLLFTRHFLVGDCNAIR